MAENFQEMNIENPNVGVENPLPSLRRTVIEPSKRRFYLNLRGIWEYRELLVFLAWRDLKTRYAQTTIGFAWAIVQVLGAAWCKEHGKNVMVDCAPPGGSRVC